MQRKYLAQSRVSSWYIGNVWQMSLSHPSGLIVRPWQHCHFLNYCLWRMTVPTPALVKHISFFSPSDTNPEQTPKVLSVHELPPHNLSGSSAHLSIPLSLLVLLQYLSLLDVHTVFKREEIPGNPVWRCSSDLGAITSTISTENIQENTCESIAGNLGHNSGRDFSLHEDGMWALIFTRPRGKETWSTMMTQS